MSKEYIAPTVEPMGGEDVAPMSTAAAWETFFAAYNYMAVGLATVALAAVAWVVPIGDPGAGDSPSVGN